MHIHTNQKPTLPQAPPPYTNTHTHKRKPNKLKSHAPDLSPLDRVPTPVAIELPLRGVVRPVPNTAAAVAARPVHSVPLPLARPRRGALPLACPYIMKVGGWYLERRSINRTESITTTTTTAQPKPQSNKAPARTPASTRRGQRAKDPYAGPSTTAALPSLHRHHLQGAVMGCARARPFFLVVALVVGIWGVRPPLGRGRRVCFMGGCVYWVLVGRMPSTTERARPQPLSVTQSSTHVTTM